MTVDLYQKSKYQTVIQSLNYFLLLLFVFWLPLNDDFLPAIMALWILTWLLEGNFRHRFSFFNKQYYLGFVAYFLLTVIHLFWTDYRNDNLTEIQQKLSFVFFPLIFAGSNHKVKSSLKIILIVFVLGNIVASLYCIFYNLITNIYQVNGAYHIKYWIYEGHETAPFWQLINMRCNVFCYSFLSVFKHPSYFGMYLIFSNCIIIHLLRKKIIKTVSLKITSAFVILFFTVFIYFLQSKACIIAYFLTILLLLGVQIQKNLKKRYVLIFSTIIVCLFAISFPNSELYRTVSSTYKSIKDPKGFSFDKSDPRIQLWYSSIQIIQNNFWFGTGPSDLNPELKVKYKQFGFNDAYTYNLNAHNQFLETFAGLGILGLIVLLFIICYGIFISISRKNELLFYFFTILVVNFCFESVLNRMAGILFMMLFVSVFVFANISITHQKQETGNIVPC